MTDLGSLGGILTWPGYVVGMSTLPNGTAHAFLWHQGKMTDLGTLGGLYSSAEDVNDHGQIVGGAHRADGQLRSVLWTVHFSHHVTRP